MATDRVLAELEQKLTGNCIKIKQFQNTRWFSRKLAIESVLFCLEAIFSTWNITETKIKSKTFTKNYKRLIFCTLFTFMQTSSTQWMNSMEFLWIEILTGLKSKYISKWQSKCLTIWKRSLVKKKRWFSKIFSQESFHSFK